MPDNHRRTGALRAKLTFQSRGDVTDGWGGTVPGGAFTDQFTVSAALRPLRGSEAVMAARLQGQQPYVVTVRQSALTRQITSNWRAVDANNPSRVFAITAPPTDPDMKNAWLEILVTEGEAS